MHPDVSIIIVNWNSVDYVRACLESIDKYSSDITYEVIVVDNASYDGSDRLVDEGFRSVKFLQAGANLGFAKANNLGARQAKADWLLFLNPDTLVLETGLKPALDKARELGNLGVAGVKLLNTDKTLQESCIQAFPTMWNRILDSNFLRRAFPRSRLWGTGALHVPGSRPLEVEMVSGACMLMKAETFNRLGGFSEDYFMYFEDTDLCLKASRGGLKNYFLPDVSIVHHGGGSSKRETSRFSSVVFAESQYRFFRKWNGIVYAAMFRFLTLVSSIVRLMMIALAIGLKSSSRDMRSLQSSLRKWSAIARWSVGKEAWSKSG